MTAQRPAARLPPIRAAAGQAADDAGAILRPGQILDRIRSSSGAQLCANGSAAAIPDQRQQPRKGRKPDADDQRPARTACNLRANADRACRLCAEDCNRLCEPLRRTTGAGAGNRCPQRGAEMRGDSAGYDEINQRQQPQKGKEHGRKETDSG